MTNAPVRRQPVARSSEQTLREQVAACTLLLNDLELLGYSGHVSARLPGQDAFLIQPFDQSRASLQPDDLLVCGFDGKATGTNVKPPSEVFLHSEILRARPDVQAIAHFHHDLTTVFTLVEGLTLKPIKNHAVRWESGIPVHADPSHVSDPALGRALAETLGRPSCAAHPRARPGGGGRKRAGAADRLRALRRECGRDVSGGGGRQGHPAQRRRDGGVPPRLRARAPRRQAVEVLRRPRPRAAGCCRRRGTSDGSANSRVIPGPERSEGARNPYFSSKNGFRARADARPGMTRRLAALRGSQAYRNNSGYFARTSAASSRDVCATFGKLSIRS